MLGHFTGQENWLDASGEPVDLHGANPHRIYTRLQPNGQRVAITEQRFRDTTNVKRAQPRIGWTTEHYPRGTVVDPDKLLRKGQPQYFHTRQAPEIGALYQQVEEFIDVAPMRSMAPDRIIRSAAIPGSRLAFLSLH